MGYSITFGKGSDAKNTWTDWKLLPESPPTVPSPKPKTNYVDIPGRAKGPLDMSKAPFNKQIYERITGSWTFVMHQDFWNTPNRKTGFEAIRKWLHGRVTRMKLEEDPAHLFYGRFTVDPPNSDRAPFAFQIGYDLEPVRYNTDGTADLDWLVDVTSWIDSGDGPVLPPDGTIYVVTSITDADIRALFN